MWSSDGGFQGDQGNAGFINSPSQFASPSAQGKRERRTNNIVPVTVRTIQNTEGDSIVISDTDVKMVAVIGIIRTVNVSSVKIIYTLDDSTGVIEAVQWLQSEQDFDEEKERPLMEMTYCRAIGTVKTQMGKKFIMVLKIEPITDMNRITTHLLEVIHDAMKLELIKKMGKENEVSAPGHTSGGMQQGLNAAPGHTMQVMPPGSGFKGLNQLVFQFIQLAPDTEAGAQRDDIYSALHNKGAPNKIDEALEFLISEGHIYSTIDDDHFKTTDAM